MDVSGVNYVKQRKPDSETQQACVFSNRWNTDQNVSVCMHVYCVLCVFVCVYFVCVCVRV